MIRYDPDKAPDSKEWLAMDEHERLGHVLNYHIAEGVTFEDEGGLNIHAVVHQIVENQVGLGDEYPVKAAIARLKKEGLSRHDAIHAVGSVLIKYFWDIGKRQNTSENISDDYFKEVSELTAQKWFDEFS